MGAGVQGQVYSGDFVPGAGQACAERERGVIVHEHVTETTKNSGSRPLWGDT